MWNFGIIGNLLYFSYVFVYFFNCFKMFLMIELFVIILKKFKFSWKINCSVKLIIKKFNEGSWKKKNCLEIIKFVVMVYYVKYLFV